MGWVGSLGCGLPEGLKGPSTSAPGGGGRTRGEADLHFLSEALHIHIDALCSGQLLRDLQGETIGVIQHKGILATHSRLGSIRLFAGCLCTSGCSFPNARKKKTGVSLPVIIRKGGVGGEKGV